MTATQDKIAQTGLKHCGRCDHDKSVKTNFAKRSGTTHGYASWCKDCNKQYDKDNRERFRRRIANNWYVRLYGITLEDVERLIELQEGKCAICENPLTDPHVDHCHITSTVRGVLCHKCNVGLGHFNDDPKLLAKALQYLGGTHGRETSAPPS